MLAIVIAERIGWGPWPDDPEGQGRRVASGVPAAGPGLADDVPARGGGPVRLLVSADDGPGAVGWA